MTNLIAEFIRINMDFFHMFIHSKKVHFVFRTAFFLLIGLGYYFFYYRELHIRFTWTSILFTLTFLISFLFLFSLFTSRIFRGISVLVFALFLIYGLINFGHFKVYRTFMNPSFGEMAPAAISMNQLWDFTFLVPPFLYVATGAYVAITIFLLWIHARKKNHEIIFQNIVVSPSYVKQRMAAKAIGFLLMHVIGLVGMYFFLKNPSAAWWNTSAYAASKGVVGHTYEIAYRQTIQPIIDDITVYAEDAENRKENVVEETIHPLDLAHMYQANLKTDSEKPTPSLPSLPEKPNILIYQLESVDAWAFANTPNPMPYFKTYRSESLSTKKFFANSCHTINAEFSILCSQYADAKNPISDKGAENAFRCLPRILGNDYGYTSELFHANDIRFWSRDILGPAWGFDESFFIPPFGAKTQDTIVIDYALSRMRESSTPMLSYVIGYTSHAPHNAAEIKRQKDEHNLVITPYDGALDEETLKNSELDEYGMRMYLGFLRPIDDTLNELFIKLKEYGLDRNTIVVVTADHRYYNFPEPTVENFYRYNEIPFFIFFPGMQGKELNRVGSHIDIAPTILHAIAKTTDKTPSSFIGTSLFSDDHPNFALSKCLGDIDFVNNDVIVKGNSDTDAYALFHAFTRISESEKQKYLTNVKGIVEESDRAIAENQLQ